MTPASSLGADLSHPHDSVVVDLTGARIWDASTVAALDAVTGKYRARGKIVGLDEHSATLHGRLSGELTGGHPG